MQLEKRDAAPSAIDPIDSELEFLRRERQRAAGRLYAALGGTRTGVVRLFNPFPWFRRYPAVSVVAVFCLGVAMLRRSVTRGKDTSDGRQYAGAQRFSWLDWLAEASAMFFATIRRAIFGALTARVLWSDAEGYAPGPAEPVRQPQSFG